MVGIIGHTHKPAHLNVLVATSAMPPVANVGEDCWEACGERGGHCPGFCGALGVIFVGLMAKEEYVLQTYGKAVQVVDSPIRLTLG